MQGHKTKIRGLAIAQNGIIATGDDDGIIRLWSDKTGEFIRVLGKQDARVGSLAFGPGGALLVSTCGSGDCADKPENVWDVATGRQVVRYQEHDNFVIASAISRNGRWVATGGGRQRAIHIWELRTGKRMLGKSPSRKPLNLVGVGSRVSAVGFSKDSLRIGFGREDPCPDKDNCPNELSDLLFSLRLPTKQQGLGTPRDITDAEKPYVRVRPRHQAWSLAHQYNEQTRYFDGLEVAQDGKSIALIKRRPDGRDGKQHLAYSFSPDGKLIVSGGNNGWLTLFRRNGDKIGEYKGHTNIVSDIATSPDGRFLVSGSGDKTIRLWNLKTRELIASLLHASNEKWIMWTRKGYFTGPYGSHKYVGWHINQGIDKNARYITAAQLRIHLFSPEIVNEAIRLASAAAAVKRLRGNDPTLRQLLAKNPPEFTIVDATVGKGHAEIALDIGDNDQGVSCCRVYVNTRNVTPSKLRAARPITKYPEALRFSVPLARGENRIRVIASNWVGESERITTLSNNSAAAPLAKYETLYVVAIGVDDYPNLPGRNLNFASKDARAMVRMALRQMKPLYKEVKVWLLVSDARDNVANELKPTKANIEDSFGYFANASDQDTTLLFIAGHGENRPNKKRSYVFLPSNARRNGDQWVLSSVLNWSDFTGALLDASGRRLFFVDTCHAQGAFNSHFIEVSARNNLIAFSATDKETFAKERPNLKHGLFTYAIKEAVAKGLADIEGEGDIDVEELARYVKRRVFKLSGGSQKPKVHNPNSDDSVLATVR